MAIPFKLFKQTLKEISKLTRKKCIHHMEECNFLVNNLFGSFIPQNMKS